MFKMAFMATVAEWFIHRHAAAAKAYHFSSAQIISASAFIHNFKLILFFTLVVIVKNLYKHCQLIHVHNLIILYIKQLVVHETNYMIKKRAMRFVQKLHAMKQLKQDWVFMVQIYQAQIENYVTVYQPFVPLIITLLQETSALDVLSFIVTNQFMLMLHICVLYNTKNQETNFLHLWSYAVLIEHNLQ